MTSIGIIGAGQIGHAIATALARAGIPATLANSRGPESLADTVAALGPDIVAGTREKAAAKDIVFVAVNWSRLPGGRRIASLGRPDRDRREQLD
jgi:predicted dinucleotide-binding enzyme